MPGAGSSDISRLRQMGNFWLNKIVNLLYGTRYTDLCYGYNAFRRECLVVIDLDAGTPTDADPRQMLWGDGFEVETLINVRIAKAGLRVFEVPSFERNRLLRHQQPQRSPMGCGCCGPSTSSESVGPGKPPCRVPPSLGEPERHGPGSPRWTTSSTDPVRPGGSRDLGDVRIRRVTGCSHEPLGGPFPEVAPVRGNPVRLR